MSGLDAFDIKILQELANDSHQSVEKLAQAVNLSPTPVRRRIRRLEAEGYLRRYTVAVDMAKCGYHLRLFVFIKLQSRDRATIAQFESMVQLLPEVTACNLVTGPFDYILQLHVENMQRYNDLLRSVLAELPGVFGIETSVVIGEVKDTVPVPH